MDAGTEPRAAPGSRTTPRDVEEYLARQPIPAQETLREVRRVLRKAVPTAQESISYGMPTLTLNGRRLHYAAYRDHYSLFGTLHLNPGLHQNPLPRGARAYE